MSRPWTEDDRTLLISCKKFLTAEKLGILLDRTPLAVYKYCEAHGIKLGMNRSKVPHARFDEHDIAEILMLHDSGASVAQIAYEFDAPHGTVWNVVHRA